MEEMAFVKEAAPRYKSIVERGVFHGPAPYITHG